MRPLAIVGILLMLGGAYVLLKGFSYTSEKHEIDLGPIQGSVEEKKSVPTWVGVVALAGGTALLVSGMRKTSGSA